MKNTILILLISTLLFSCGNEPETEPLADAPLVDQPYNVPIDLSIEDEGMKLSARLPQNFFLSPDGNDNNPGTFAKPKFQLKKVWPLIPGDSVFLLGGNYAYTLSQYLGGSHGSATKRIYIGAFPGHKPVITKAASYPESEQDLIYFEGDYFHWKGIEIAYFKQNPGGYHWPAFRTPGMSNNLFENISYHDNGAGFSVRGASNNNEFRNCDFYNNADPYSKPAYENADGIDLHYVTPGNTNTLKGCRAYWNADDGFDCWDNNGNVIFENCWSFYNGYQAGKFTTAGNGSGFKLGTTANNSTKQLRTLKNCIAYKNRSYGIVKNEANCLILVENCTVVETGELGFWSGSWNTTPTTYTKNISYKQSNKIGSFDKQTNNSWQGKTVSDADFKNLSNPEQLTAARNPDGSLPGITFLMVNPKSNLAGLGASFDSSGIVVPPDTIIIIPVDTTWKFYAPYNQYDNKTADNRAKPNANKTLLFKGSIYVRKGEYKVEIKE